MNNHIQQLEKLDRRLKALGFAESLIFWDAATLAPKNAVAGRGTTLEEMSELYYTLFINEGTRTLLKNLEAVQDHLPPIPRAKFDFYKEEYEQIACMPVEEYAAYANLKTQSSKAWEEAKASGDYSIFEPFLQKVIDFQRKYVGYRNLGGHPYNTLLNEYERGLTIDIADDFFATLKAVIVPLLKKITDKAMDVPSPFEGVTFDIEGQKAFSKAILGKMTFDMDSGIIAESVHPFTLNLTRDDVRITTAYQEDNALSSIYSTIHECGHGLYEQNIGEDLAFTKIGTGTTMGIHESQSRIYENNVARSEAFWKAYFPLLADIFPQQLKDSSPEACYRACNDVKPSLVRIEADELTYALHIMIRYELEKAIMEGALEAKDLPQAWNDKYEAYLGIRPANDVEGVLQDVHWSEGLFGYFPSYALGSAYACQFEAAMNRQFDVAGAIERDDLSQINAWLKENIHQFGCMKTPAQIIKDATGEDFNPAYFTDYLVNKYTKLYDL